MKKRNIALLVLVVLVLMAGVGAKQYSTITMGDGEWIGLGPGGGRIVFEDFETDEIGIVDAEVGIGTSDPSSGYRLHVREVGSPARMKIEAAGAGVYDTLMMWQNPDTTYYWYIDDSDSDTFKLSGSPSGVALAVTTAGRVGVNDSTPSYDLDVNGDIRADEDVLANETVFVGSIEDAEEDAGRMSIRADSADGGFVLWTIRNFEGQVSIFENAAGGGDTGPEMVLWIRWLAHSNTTGAFTHGEAMLINGPHAQSQVCIAADGERDVLTVWFYEGEVIIGTVGSAGHLYDVTLQMMWVED